ncbi:MAG: DegT/DnrJ/EryC1/StrS family aminotransferase [Acidobacteriota bacterium]|nr:DegT/DnrJ/EryC1/StrS family aminotransferase [Acidobacteriota bacterium]
MDPVPLLDLEPQYAALKTEIDAAIRRVVDSQRFILGPEVEGLEQEVARFVDVPHAIGCASGTDALILALAALAVGPGDEVVTTPFSFFATASCAYKVGARPVFVDILPDTLQLDPERLHVALTPETRAIMPVHLFGQCAEMDAILDIAAGRGIPVIEDAAQALGASYESVRLEGRVRAGGIGTLGCYSFFPSKNLGGFGDGGMIVTRDGELDASLRALRVHGERRRYEHDRVGWNSRLDALQAAVLRVKLPHLDAWSRGRAANAERYDRELTASGVVETGRVRLPVRAERCEHIFNQYTLRVDDREGLMQHLRRLEIGHAVYYPIPLHLQKCFADLGYREGDFPEAERASREVISIPVFPELGAGRQQRVIEAIVDYYRA